MGSLAAVPLVHIREKKEKNQLNFRCRRSAISEFDRQCPDIHRRLPNLGFTPANSNDDVGRLATGAIGVFDLRGKGGTRVARHYLTTAVQRYLHGAGWTF